MAKLLIVGSLYSCIYLCVYVIRYSIQKSKHTFRERLQRENDNADLNVPSIPVLLLENDLLLEHVTSDMSTWLLVNPGYTNSG